jgi:hypothetical protein
MPDSWEDLAKLYVAEVAAQTKGSHRVKRANDLGLQLATTLNMVAGTPAEHSTAAYLARAQLRANLARKCLSDDTTADERVSMLLLLFERLALENVLELDKMEALGAIHRIRRCARCTGWFWSRVKVQRYCSRRCRLRHYHTSERGKKYKREWARRAYHEKKERIAEETRRFTMSSAPSRKRTGASN